AASGTRLSQISVRIRPGHTQFTRTGASSTASPRVRCSTAPAMAVEIAEPLVGRWAIIPSVRVSEPLGCGKVGLGQRTAPRAAPVARGEGDVIEGAVGREERLDSGLVGDVQLR